MKITTLNIAAGCLMLMSSVSHAATEAFCDQYAQTGVAQHISNIAHKCNLQGLRWSADFISQKSWCKTVRRHIAENETAERRKALTQCGVPETNIRKPFKSLEYGPADFLITTAIERAKVDDVRSIQVFGREGVDFNWEWGGNDSTVLFHAIKHQASKVVRYLIGFVNPNRSTNGGGAPLAFMLANEKVDYDLLRFLLENGVDADYHGEYRTESYIPLMVAAQKRDLRAVRDLITIGKASPNVFDTVPPLTYALKNKDTEIALLLINGGANLNFGMYECGQMTGPANDKMPLDLATEMNDPRLINVIKSKGGKTAAECAKLDAT